MFKECMRGFLCKQLAGILYVAVECYDVDFTSFNNAFVRELRMNEEEKYLFDLRGYLSIDGVLGDRQIRALNDVWDQHIEDECDINETSRRFGQLLEWGQPFIDLIDNPSITPYLEVILGQQFRLDHIYADLIRSGNSPIGARLHGGGTPFDPCQFYQFHGGKMYNGLTVVAYNLADVGPEDGGFGCVPGSHKSNLGFPGDWKDMDENLHSCVSRITGLAGTAVIFTEALTHGALPWTGSGERRTIFFKYSPNPISWSPRYFDEQDFEGLTDSQRFILEPPNARPPNRKTKPKLAGE
ncbi:MAG: phytanoyl-CoA dioxygenase family protein [Candidatus Latescibacterota bacterium]|nr:phytanoyl-CoA dioxygenase family protein [Candidatus Latescibacterota bacterium]